MSPVQLPCSARPLQLLRRRVRRKEYLFRGGQPMRALYLIHAGQFKTSLLNDDGRERVTGFSLRGDLLGIDALGSDHYGCDAVALDVCEVWELPCAQFPLLEKAQPGFWQELNAVLAAELRRNWHWMLSIGTLTAEQRVVAFLLDLSQRLQALGYSGRRLRLPMTRAEVGSFLGIQLETVARALSRLDQLGHIRVHGRDVELLQVDALSVLLCARRQTAAGESCVQLPSLAAAA